MTKVLHEGRREGASRFYIADDFSIELGFMCTSEDKDEELRDMYGPQCWHGIDGDPGGLKNTMWYDVMKEFNCEAVSAWLSCDERMERAFTHKAWRKNGRTSHLDYILGPVMGTCTSKIHNDVK